jgi:hypothetical protein
VRCPAWDSRRFQLLLSLARCCRSSFQDRNNRGRLTVALGYLRCSVQNGGFRAIPKPCNHNPFNSEGNSSPRCKVISYLLISQVSYYRSKARRATRLISIALRCFPPKRHVKPPAYLSLCKPTTSACPMSYTQPAILDIELKSTTPDISRELSPL